MSDLDTLLNDERFRIAPPEKQGAILGIFFDDRIGSYPAAKALSPDQLPILRQAFVQKNLPDPRSYLLGGKDAVIRDARESIIRPPDPTRFQQFVKNVTPKVKTAVLASTVLPVLPAAEALVAGVTAKQEAKNFIRRGQIQEGLGEPRSKLEGAAELALRGLMFGGLYDRAGAPQTLKKTLLDMLDIAAASGAAAEFLAPAKIARTTKVVENISQMLEKMPGYQPELELLGELTKAIKKVPRVKGAPSSIEGSQLTFGDVPAEPLPGAQAGPGKALGELFGPTAPPAPLGSPKPPIAPVIEAPPPKPIEGLGQFNYEQFTNPKVRQIYMDMESAPAIQERMLTAKRGVMSDEMVDKLADGVALTADDIRALPEGAVLNSEQMRKALKILDASGESAVELVKQWVDVGGPGIGSGEAAAWGPVLGDFKKTYPPLIELLVKVRAISSELGRALRQKQIPIERMSNTAKSLLEAAFEEGGVLTDEKAIEVLNRLAKIPNLTPQLALRTMVKTLKPTLVDKIVTVITAGYMSNPLTHLISNPSGNVLGAASALAEKRIAGGLDLLRSKITGTPRTRFAGEAKAAYEGMRQGAKDARIAYIESLKSNLYGDQAKQMVHTPAFEGKTGRVVNLPFASVGAQDEFAKTILRRAQLYAAAYRKAALEGKKGTALWEAMEKTVASPPKAWLTKLTSPKNPEGTEQFAKEFTYQSDLGPAAQAFNRFRKTFAGGLGRLAIPFYPTLVNMMKFLGQRTLSVAPGTRNVEALMQGGGPSMDALARLSLGNSIGAFLFMLARKGYITGSLPDYRKKAERDLMGRSGEEPLALHIAGHYIPMGRIQPIATMMGIAKGMSDAYDEHGVTPTPEQAMRLGKMIAVSMTNMSVATGIREIMNAWADERQGSKFVDRFMGGLVPGILAFPTRFTDPYKRKPVGVAQSMMARLPFISEKVPPARNVFGEPIERDSIIPWYPEKNSPTEKELKRLHKEMNFRIGFPSLTLRGRKLSPTEYDRFLEQGGQLKGKEVEALIADPDYQNMTDPEKMRELQRIEREAPRDIADDVALDAEMRSLGFPDFRDMGLPENLVFGLREDLKAYIDDQEYRDLKDDERKKEVLQRIKENLDLYKQNLAPVGP